MSLTTYGFDEMFLNFIFVPKVVEKYNNVYRKIMVPQGGEYYLFKGLIKDKYDLGEFNYDILMETFKTHKYEPDSNLSEMYEKFRSFVVANPDKFNRLYYDMVVEMTFYINDLNNVVKLSKIGGMPILEDNEFDMLTGLHNIIKERPIDTLYNLTIPNKIKGFNVRVLKKGTNIYRNDQGFLFKDDLLYKNKSKTIYFSDKYVAYYMCKYRWCGLQSYKIDRDVVLFDYFNVENLKKLSTRISKDLLNIMYELSGYGSNCYNIPVDIEYPFMNKTIVKVEGLNPKRVFNKNKYDIDLLMFLNGIGIDGFIRRAIQSSNYEGGAFVFEEMIIDKDIGFTFDYKDPLCWVNWKLRPELKNGFVLDSYSKFSFSENIENKNFKLINFWFDNVYKFEEINYSFVMIYDVYYFYNLNRKIDRRATKQKIVDMVNRYKNLKLLVLENCNNISEEINLPLISYNNKVLTLGTKCEYSNDYIEIKCNYSRYLPKVYKVL